MSIPTVDDWPSKKCATIEGISGTYGVANRPMATTVGSR